jgi:hypothetical protein
LPVPYPGDDSEREQGPRGGDDRAAAQSLAQTRPDNEEQRHAPELPARQLSRPGPGARTTDQDEQHRIRAGEQGQADDLEPAAGAEMFSVRRQGVPPVWPRVEPAAPDQQRRQQHQRRGNDDEDAEGVADPDLGRRGPVAFRQSPGPQRQGSEDGQTGADKAGHQQQEEGGGTGVRQPAGAAGTPIAPPGRDGFEGDEDRLAGPHQAQHDQRAVAGGQPLDTSHEPGKQAGTGHEETGSVAEPGHQDEADAGGRKPDPGRRAVPRQGMNEHKQHQTADGQQPFRTAPGPLWARRGLGGPGRGAARRVVVRRRAIWLRQQRHCSARVREGGPAGTR